MIEPARNQGTSQRVGWILLVALVAAIGVQTGRALGRQQSAADPTATVKIDLQRVFNELQESRAVRQRLDGMISEIQEHQQAQQAEIEAMGERLDALDQASPEARQLQNDMVMRLGALEGWIAAKMQLHGTDRRLETLRMYNKIVDAVAELAEANGYDYVVLTDPPFEAQPDMQVNEIYAQIFARRMLYSNEARDVTDDLIVRMDNRFRAGQ